MPSPEALTAAIAATMVAPVRLALPGTVWIAADMHVREHTPGTRDAFIAFVQAAATEADALVLAGDIFDAWVGDDVLDAPPAWLAQVVEALAETGRRIPLWLGHGNRDFLLGERFAAAVHGKLLPDPVRLDTDYGPVLLCHGDALCTDDLPYQQMRALVRNPQWQAQMLARPLAERIHIAAELRARSESGKADKSQDIMDVSAPTVQACLAASGLPLLIHGHTHRPARHVAVLDGQRAERWVLQDWSLEADDASPRGGWISLDADGPAFNDLTPD